MADIFISYAHEDQIFVRRIVDALEAEGVSVWWDHTIPPGQTWDSFIARELNASKGVIVVWSRNSVESDWVKEEATLAHEMRKFLPIRAEDDIQPPMGFRRIQAVSFGGWRGEQDHPSWRLLLGEVRRLADSVAPTLHPAIPRAHSAPIEASLPVPNNRPPWLILGATGALAAAGLIAFLLIRQPAAEIVGAPKINPPQTDVTHVQMPQDNATELERLRRQNADSQAEIERLRRPHEQTTAQPSSPPPSADPLQPFIGNWEVVGSPYAPGCGGTIYTMIGRNGDGLSIHPSDRISELSSDVPTTIVFRLVAPGRVSSMGITYELDGDTLVARFRPDTSCTFRRR